MQGPSTNIWYPRIPRRRLPAMLGITLLGAAVGGVYGALHDQLSYTISPEYFTKLKFAQFAYADFGWPHRVLAAEVGFLATAGVGLIAGWVLARVGLDELAAAAGRIHILKAMALVVAGGRG